MAQNDTNCDPPIPHGLEILLEELSAEVLLKTPSNLYIFLADFLKKKLRERNIGNSPEASGDEGNVNQGNVNCTVPSLNPNSIHARLFGLAEILQETLDLGKNLKPKKCKNSKQTTNDTVVTPNSTIPDETENCQHDSLRQRLIAMRQLLEGSLELGTKFAEKYRKAGICQKKLQTIPVVSEGSEVSEVSEMSNNLGIDSRQAQDQEDILHKRLSVLSQLLIGTVELGTKISKNISEKLPLEPKEELSVPRIDGGGETLLLNYEDHQPSNKTLANTLNLVLELHSAQSIEKLICKEVKEFIGQVKLMTNALDQAHEISKTLELLGKRQGKIACSKPYILNQIHAWHPLEVTNNGTQYSQTTVCVPNEENIQKSQQYQLLNEATQMPERNEGSNIKLEVDTRISHDPVEPVKVKEESVLRIPVQMEVANVKQEVDTRIHDHRMEPVKVKEESVVRIPVPTEVAHVKQEGANIKQEGANVKQEGANIKHEVAKRTPNSKESVKVKKEHGSKIPKRKNVKQESGARIIPDTKRAGQTIPVTEECPECAESEASISEVESGEVTHCVESEHETSEVDESCVDLNHGVDKTISKTIALKSFTGQVENTNPTFLQNVSHEQVVQHPSSNGKNLQTLKDVYQPPHQQSVLLNHQSGVDERERKWTNGKEVDEPKMNFRIPSSIGIELIQPEMNIHNNIFDEPIEIIESEVELILVEIHEPITDVFIEEVSQSEVELTLVEIHEPITDIFIEEVSEDYVNVINSAVAVGVDVGYIIADDMMTNIEPGQWEQEQSENVQFQTDGGFIDNSFDHGQLLLDGSWHTDFELPIPVEVGLIVDLPVGQYGVLPPRDPNTLHRHSESNDDEVYVDAVVDIYVTEPGIGDNGFNTNQSGNLKPIISPILPTTNQNTSLIATTTAGTYGSLLPQSHTFSPGNSETNLSKKIEINATYLDFAFLSEQFETFRQILIGKKSLGDSPIHTVIIGTGAGILVYGLVKGIWTLGGCVANDRVPFQILTQNTTGSRLSEICASLRQPPPSRC